MITKYLNIALILTLVVGAGVLKFYTPFNAERVAAQTVAGAQVDQLPN